MGSQVPLTRIATAVLFAQNKCQVVVACRAITGSAVNESRFDFFGIVKKKGKENQYVALIL